MIDADLESLREVIYLFEGSTRMPDVSEFRLALNRVESELKRLRACQADWNVAAMHLDAAQKRETEHLAQLKAAHELIYKLKAAINEDVPEVAHRRPEWCQCGTEYTCKIACSCSGPDPEHDPDCHYGMWEHVPAHIVELKVAP